ncbi:MAG: hypothetical protein SPM02_02845 [Bacteroidales bacterium]|nr:hypothetical protein [Bacteroidales bacterium]
MKKLLINIKLRVNELVGLSTKSSLRGEKSKKNLEKQKKKRILRRPEKGGESVKRLFFSFFERVLLWMGCGKVPLLYIFFLKSANLFFTLVGDIFVAFLHYERRMEDGS